MQGNLECQAGQGGTETCCLGDWPLSLKLYFLRHGETTHSTTGAYCGDLDPELTAEGVQMAGAFAEAYRSTPWTAAYVSPMKRTVDLGRYRDRIDMLAGSISIVKFDLHGPLLQVLGDRVYMGDKLSARPGT